MYIENLLPENLASYETGIFYKKIFVVFDDDMDERIIEFIDNISDRDIEDIITISEHEGHLRILWKKPSCEMFYPSLRDMKEINVFLGGILNDLWTIENQYINE